MTPSDDTAPVREQAWAPTSIPIWARPWPRQRPFERVSLQRNVVGDRAQIRFSMRRLWAGTQGGLAAHLAAGSWAGRASSSSSGADHRARGSAHAEAAGAGQEHRRGGIGQGRGRQIDHRGQSGARLGGAGRAGRAPGCRYLRPQPAADDGTRRPQARRPGRQAHHAAARARRRSDVHRLHDRCTSSPWPGADRW